MAPSTGWISRLWVCETYPAYFFALLPQNTRCGNGLLTHILTSEGYDGQEIDVQARTSWENYLNSIQSQLHTLSFDPTLPSSANSAFLKERPSSLGTTVTNSHLGFPSCPLYATHRGYCLSPVVLGHLTLDLTDRRMLRSLYQVPILRIR
jgi:hypothetical protein